MSRIVSHTTLYSFAALVTVTEIGCSAPQRVYADDDAGVGGSAATGGSRTAPNKTLAVGGSSTSDQSATGGVGGLSNAGDTSSSGGSSDVASTPSTGGTTSAAGGSSSLLGGSTSAGTGGSSSQGGTSAILVTGGAPTAGGAATGGNPTTGGAPSTTTSASTGGGVATGGATPGTGGAGAATGGAATGGAPATNQFANGPCVTTTDLSSLDVYASSGTNIYHKSVTASNSGTWTKIPLLDATQLDIRSRLDCSGDTNTVRLVATGSNPVGAYMQAVGFGNAFSAFTRELPTKTFSPPGVAVAALGDTEYLMAGAFANPVLIFYESPERPNTDYSPDGLHSLMSAPDVIVQWTCCSDPTHFEMVAFLSSVEMAYFDYSYGYARYYLPVVTVSPPQGTTFTYSPTVCSHTDTAAKDFTRHVAVVAGGKLYSAHSGPDWADGTTTFSEWELAGDIAPASAPDCVVTSDNTVHIVFLTSAGTIAHVSRTGTSGEWSKGDLGGY